MAYLFQRIIQNHFQWVRPSPGRLGPSGEGEYVKENGFGHEDWNFNKKLLIDGHLYGYCYYQPAIARRDESFNIAFATYTNRQWYLIGFYLNCEFVTDPPTNIDVVQQKIKDLKLLGSSLGNPYKKLTDKQLITRVSDEAQWLKWKVLPENAVRTNQPLAIPKKVIDVRNYRIGSPTELSNEIFKSLYSLAQEYVVDDIYDYDSDFPEGKEIESKHLRRERNQLLIKAAKDCFKHKHGRLFCQVCGFDFESKYGGELGGDFIEAHHILPLSQLNGETQTKVEDIVLVCSNCHRMLHRKRPWLQMNDLKTLLI